MLGDRLRFESSPLWLPQDGSYHLRSRLQCPRVLCSEQDCKKYTKKRCTRLKVLRWHAVALPDCRSIDTLPLTECLAAAGSEESSHVLEKLLLWLPFEGGAVLQYLLAVISLSEGFLPLSLQVILTSSYQINSLTCRSHHNPYQAIKKAWDLLLSLRCMFKASMWLKSAHLPLPPDQPMNPPFL